MPIIHNDFNVLRSLFLIYSVVLCCENDRTVNITSKQVTAEQKKVYGQIKMKKVRISQIKRSVE